MWSIAARALSTYRTQYRQVLPTAALLFGVAATLETALLLALRPLHSHSGGLAGIVLALGNVMAQSLALVGVVVFAGLAEHLVEHDQHGERRHPTVLVLRGLAIRRLIVADVGLAALTLAGWALFVLPGLFAFTALCLVGPVITMEHRPVGSAFKRAWQLTRPNFWLVARCVTLPVTLEALFVHSFDTTALGSPLLATFLARALLGMTVGATVGLIEATLAVDLMHAPSPSPGEAAKRG